MSRLSQRTWSKGGARDAGPVRQVGTVRVKDVADVEIREPRCSSDGAPTQGLRQNRPVLAQPNRKSQTRDFP
jgi:hypothetical protein